LYKSSGKRAARGDATVDHLARGDGGGDGDGNGNETETEDCRFVSILDGVDVVVNHMSVRLSNYEREKKGKW
jgi:hypothetical protein